MGHAATAEGPSGHTAFDPTNGLLDEAEDRWRLEQQLLLLCAELKEVRLADEQAQLKGAEFGQALSDQRERHVQTYLSGL